MKKAIVSMFMLFALITTGKSQSIYPFLQGPSHNSIWVTWITGTGTQTTVNWGTSSGALTNVVTGTHTVVTQGASSHIYHKAQITGLNPDTYYYYTITTGASTSAEYRFKTQPVPGTSTGVYRILVTGDNQILSQPRYDSLIVRAKRQIETMYGVPYEEAISLHLNVGDQVDVGTLSHYKDMHFAKTKYVSGNVPLMPIVGNHETYGTLGMSAYYAHFELDQMQYGGIPSNTEDYYAFQTANILYIRTSSENTTTAQTNWIQQVLTAGDNDPNIDWIIVDCHKPINAEQYVGDISYWFRDQIVPMVAQSPKTCLMFTAHHHLYHRGQLRNEPVYQMISGGTAWDQLWGMSTEQDFEDVQKTIDYWPFNIITFDLTNRKMDMQTYCIGNVNIDKGTLLVDEIHRYYGVAAPNTPSITNTFVAPIDLPFTFTSSPYATSTTELVNSVEYQISADPTFSTVELSKLFNYENLYGTGGAPNWYPVDIMQGVNMFEWTVPNFFVSNGVKHIRIRHRDRNLSWSNWSTPVQFEVQNSSTGSPVVVTDTTVYALNAPITVTYLNGPGNATDWVGIYKKGDVPGGVGSTEWNYCTGPAGTMTFNLGVSLEYYAAFFELDGYTEIAPRAPFFVGSVPNISTDMQIYQPGNTVQVTYNNAPALTGHWMGIYKMGDVPGQDIPLHTHPVAGAAASYNVTGLPLGFYFVTYFINIDNYLEIAPRVQFQVGDTPATLVTDKLVYNLQEPIVCTHSNGVGHPKDWLGIFNLGDDPNVDPLIGWKYVGGVTAGTTTMSVWDFTGTNNEIPQTPGDYFVVLFTNDAYIEISNRVEFEVVGSVDVVETPKPEKPYKMEYDHVNGLATISGKENIERIDLHGTDGKLIGSTDKVNAPQYVLDIKGKSSGIYLVTVYGAGQRLTFRLYTSEK